MCCVTCWCGGDTLCAFLVKSRMGTNRECQRTIAGLLAMDDEVRGRASTTDGHARARRRRTMGRGKVPARLRSRGRVRRAADPMLPAGRKGVIRPDTQTNTGLPAPLLLFSLTREVHDRRLDRIVNTRFRVLSVRSSLRIIHPRFRRISCPCSFSCLLAIHGSR